MREAATIRRGRAASGRSAAFLAAPICRPEAFTTCRSTAGAPSTGKHDSGGRPHERQEAGGRGGLHQPSSAASFVRPQRARRAPRSWPSALLAVECRFGREPARRAGDAAAGVAAAAAEEEAGHAGGVARGRGRRTQHEQLVEGELAVVELAAGEREAAASRSAGSASPRRRCAARTLGRVPLELAEHRLEQSCARALGPAAVERRTARSSRGSRRRGGPAARGSGRRPWGRAPRDAGAPRTRGT